MLRAMLLLLFSHVRYQELDDSFKMIFRDDAAAGRRLFEDSCARQISAQPRRHAIFRASSIYRYADVLFTFIYGADHGHACRLENFEHI